MNVVYVANIKNVLFTTAYRFLFAFCSSLLLFACASKPFSLPLKVPYDTEAYLHIEVEGSKTKKVTFTGFNRGEYASISVFSNGRLLIDKLHIATLGAFEVSALISFDTIGQHALSIRAHNATLELHNVLFDDITSITLPKFSDTSAQAGLDKVSSIKYGGPSIADIDNDGDYDFIVNNHNAESSKLYWNNGDGSVTKHNKNLARWFMHDLHGTALGDYDNDGDLDLVVTQGGGNGKNPSKANFYLNDKSNFIRYTGDVGIHKGGRGRGARWLDMDTDGDLDLLLFNEEGLVKTKPQHFFYRNNGAGKFELTTVNGIENEHPSRVLVTDLNNDQIDDIILYAPLSVWLGNGDFTYTNINANFPSSLLSNRAINAIADIDIDNDGDLDLYLAIGKKTVGWTKPSTAVDFDPFAKQLSIKPKGLKGRDAFTFKADSKLELSNYSFLSRGGFRGEDYPIFLGAQKKVIKITPRENIVLIPSNAEGWPEDRKENGIYFGYRGGNQWKAELVRNDNIFWSFHFTLTGVNHVKTAFEPENRLTQDVLLMNDNGIFLDVSSDWDLPSGSHSTGVTRGDFNNDGHQDLFVYRWGDIASRISDYMLLNTGQGNFETLTMHGANHVGGPGNGDMGQAFDFDLDGDIDLLNGSEGGEWYLYTNEGTEKANYLNIRVGSSPKASIDPIGAVVELFFNDKTLRKRVGSAGEIFSQSLLNIVHFGVGEVELIDKVEVTWRNGEKFVFTELPVNRVVSTLPVSEGHQIDLMNKKKPLAQAPYINILNEDILAKSALTIGEDISVEVEYTAGTNQQVIWADEGGIRFWLRQFKSKWVPQKDTVLVDDEALYSESGKSQKTFSTKDIIPTSDLPEGHFYLLRVTFTASDGNTYSKEIYPLNFVAPE
ncbi:CRTAC1 family protein [Agaribacter marinus]|uniref:CRTAC1 family protein n=1 Tax=Agaribacter marinus TaxID=1431249 RepID=UPI0024E07DA2|nr:CRTAC1 family protein [Agaribacter marinus]